MSCLHTSAPFTSTPRTKTHTDLRENTTHFIPTEQTGNNHSPAWTPCKGLVTEHKPSPLQGQERSSAKQNKHFSVHWSGGTYSWNWVRVSRQRLEALPCFYVPYPHAFVKLEREERHKGVWWSTCLRYSGCYSLATAWALSQLGQKAQDTSSSLGTPPWTPCLRAGHLHTEDGLRAFPQANTAGVKHSSPDYKLCLWGETQLKWTVWFIFFHLIFFSNHDLTQSAEGEVIRSHPLDKSGSRWLETISCIINSVFNAYKLYYINPGCRNPVSF